MILNRYAILLLFLISFLVRLPLLHTEFLRENDSVDYINVAQNIAEGNGFTRSVKGYFFDDKPVIASGSLVKPPLVPSIFAILLLIKNDFYTIQFFNLFIGAIDVVLFYLLARHFLSNKLSFIASLLIGLNPNLIIENRFTVGEPIFYLLILSFFIVFFRIKESKIKYVFLGLIAGLSYLTRVEGLILISLLVLFSRKKPLYVFTSLLSFIAVCLPNLIINYKTSGNPFYSYYFSHLSILSFGESTKDFYHAYPPPLEFIKKNYLAIAKTIVQLNKSTLEVLTSFRFLGFLSILFFLSIYKNFRSLFPLDPLVIFFLISYLIQTLTWSAFCCFERHLALLYILLVLIIFVLWKKEKSKKILYFIVILNLLIYALYNIHQIKWIRESIGALEKRKSETSFSWIRQKTDKNDIIATRWPFDLYLYTKRPTILIPEKIQNKVEDQKEFKAYIEKYNIKYFYTEKSDLDNFLKKNGVLAFQKGENRVYCVSNCAELRLRK